MRRAGGVFLCLAVLGYDRAKRRGQSLFIVHADSNRAHHEDIFDRHQEGLICVPCWGRDVACFDLDMNGRNSGSGVYCAGDNARRGKHPFKQLVACRAASVWHGGPCQMTIPIGVSSSSVGSV